MSPGTSHPLGTILGARYKDSAFFAEGSDGLRGVYWLFGWWDGADGLVDAAISAPQTVLFATSAFQPRPIITALAVGNCTAVATRNNVSHVNAGVGGFMYTSRESPLCVFSCLLPFFAADVR